MRADWDPEGSTGSLFGPASPSRTATNAERSWLVVKGTMIHEAMSEGRVVAQSVIGKNLISPRRIVAYPVLFAPHLKTQRNESADPGDRSRRKDYQ